MNPYIRSLRARVEWRKSMEQSVCADAELLACAQNGATEWQQEKIERRERYVRIERARKEALSKSRRQQREEERERARVAALVAYRTKIAREAIEEKRAQELKLLLDEAARIRGLE